MSLVDCVRAFTVDNDLVSYYAGPGDNDHDGTPDRADFNDGNGVDCSGWVWAAMQHCGIDFPLSSSAGYAFMAKDRGWIVPNLRNALPGDIVIYDRFGDAYASNGPRGHVGILMDMQGPTWLTSESRGGKGVGLYPRQWNFWVMAVRVPQGAPPMTAEQLAALIAFLHKIDNARKDEPAMPKHVLFDGHSHVFAVTPDNRLRHDYYNGAKWQHDYPAEIALPSARFTVGQTLDARTAESGQSENPIDVYAQGKVGEFVHVFWTGASWATEVFA